MSVATEKTHLEMPGPTGWETACGISSSGLTSVTDEVDCGACKRTTFFKQLEAEQSA